MKLTTSFEVYRRRVIAVEAVQFTEATFREVAAICGFSDEDVAMWEAALKKNEGQIPSIVVHDPKGPQWVYLGDWLIATDDGGVEFMAKDKFAKEFVVT